MDINRQYLIRDLLAIALFPLGFITNYLYQINGVSPSLFGMGIITGGTYVGLCKFDKWIKENRFKTGNDTFKKYGISVEENPPEEDEEEEEEDVDVMDLLKELEEEEEAIQELDEEEEESRQYEDWQ